MPYVKAYLMPALFLILHWTVFQALRQRGEGQTPHDALFGVVERVRPLLLAFLENVLNRVFLKLVFGGDYSTFAQTRGGLHGLFHRLCNLGGENIRNLPYNTVF